MATTSLSNYLYKVNCCIENEDGRGLANWLSLRDPHVMSPYLRIPEPDADVDGYLGDFVNWPTIVGNHLRCLWVYDNKDWDECFRCYQELSVALNTEINAHKTAWCLPVIYECYAQLRKFADRVQSKLKFWEEGKSPLELTAALLSSAFRSCTDNKDAEISKKVGLVFLAVEQMKIFYKLGRLGQMKSLCQTINKISDDVKERVRKPDYITFLFYEGRRAMFMNDLQTAAENLDKAFYSCHRRSVKNKRFILAYLIPIKYIQGILPNTALLQKYDLGDQFLQVTQAIRHGDISKFDNAIDANEEYFIKYGTYLILLRAKDVAIRNLFKKIFIMSENHMIPIATFEAALRHAGMADIDLDETACYLATMINDGKIKGYISHSHQKLVLSKQGGFPRLPINT